MAAGVGELLRRLPQVGAGLGLGAVRLPEPAAYGDFTDFLRVGGGSGQSPTVHAPSPNDPELDHWIATFRGPLVGLIASWGATWARAEELAMDTFAEAWLGRDRFVGDRSAPNAVGPWLRGIAFHLLAADRRAQRKAPARLDAEPVAPTPAEPGEQHERLRAAFAQLRVEHQEILRMHYLESTPAGPLAALLGISRKAVEGRLYQARIALRERVARLVPTGGGR